MRDNIKLKFPFWYCQNFSTYFKLREISNQDRRLEDIESLGHKMCLVRSTDLKSSKDILREHVNEMVEHSRCPKQSKSRRRRILRTDRPAPPAARPPRLHGADYETFGFGK